MKVHNIFFVAINTNVRLNFFFFSEKALLEHLPFGSQCTEAEAEILKKLYESKLKKYYQHPDQILPGLANTSVLNIINTATNVVEQRLGKEFDISKVVSGKVSPGG